MNLPAVRATTRPAVQQMGNGDTYDFVLAPTRPGVMRFAVSSAANRLLAALPARVQVQKAPWCKVRVNFQRDQ